MPVPPLVQTAFEATRRFAQSTTPRAQTAKIAAIVAVAVPAGVVLAKKQQARRERRAQERAGMPALTTPPHPGGDQLPVGPPPDPEVFSPGFNIHPELSRVPTLLDGAEVSEDIRMLAGMYNQTYETPEYDANAALEMIMGHPPGTRDHGKTED